MAVTFHGGPDEAPLGQAARAASLAGAVVSVALIAGMVIWGYRLAVRDVAGVPVLRAIEGPMRIAPADPGGEVMAHQGLAVNTVAAEGAAAPAADSIRLAPRPVDLAAEDAPGTFAVPAAPVSGRAEVNTGLLLDAAPAAGDDPIARALAEAGVVSDAVPLAGSLDAAGAAVAEGERRITLPAGGTMPAIRPAPRPLRLAAADAVAAPEPRPEIDPATLAPGTRLVQLGAFDSVEAARADWDKIQARFAALMADKARVIEAAQSGGRSFFRLRAEGFTDEAAARRFCAALLAEGASCIPVAHR